LLQVAEAAVVLAIEEIATAKQHQAMQGKLVMVRLQGKMDRPRPATAAAVVLEEVEPTAAMVA
jgi:hypothetical protein